MSQSSLSTGMLPTVSLKNSLAMMAPDITRSDGINSRSLPKRVGCLAYWCRTYSPSNTCA